MGAVRDYADELDGYAYLPRLGVYPKDLLELGQLHGDDDRAILAGLQEHGIPSAEETWFDARATEDELLTGVYLKVRPRELIDELKPRPGHQVVAVVEGEAKVALGQRQMRIVQAGEVVRIPSELPHTLESVGNVALKVEAIAWA